MSDRVTCDYFWDHNKILILRLFLIAPPQHCAEFDQQFLSLTNSAFDKPIRAIKLNNTLFGLINPRDIPATKPNKQINYLFNSILYVHVILVAPLGICVNHSHWVYPQYSPFNQQQASFNISLSTYHKIHNNNPPPQSLQPQLHWIMQPLLRSGSNTS